MFLIIMILSMPVSGQADINYFNVDVELGVVAPQYDARLGHFDILPELVVITSRYGGNELLQSYILLDTLEVVAERYAPAANNQQSRVDYRSIAPGFLRYAFYVFITIITALMIAIISGKVPYWIGKSQVCGKPQTVSLQLPVRRKSQCGLGTKRGNR